MQKVEGSSPFIRFDPTRLRGIESLIVLQEDCGVPGAGDGAKLVASYPR
jgi:hypothetical protein